MSTVQVVQGFSLTNRWLLYASFMLSPAQFIAGLKGRLPLNLGFLAYNWYTQILWYRAVRNKQLHALALVVPHLNILFALTYLGGVTSRNTFRKFPYMAIFLGLGTAGLMVLNTVSGWFAWKFNESMGIGVYQFFFYGWRTLSPGWYKFFLLWQIFDSIWASSFAILAIVVSISSALRKDYDGPKWWYKYAAIPAGAVATLSIGWPLILWMELIVARNHIESETDWIAVWLFVVQVGTLLIPSRSKEAKDDSD